MNKVLLTLSIIVLSGSLLAQESPTTPKRARTDIQGPEIALASWFTVIRWTTNNPGGSPVQLWNRALWHGSQGPEPNRRKSDQVEPLPFIDGFSACTCTTLSRGRPTTTRWTRWSPTAGATG